MGNRVVAIGLAIFAIAAMSGCRKNDRREKPEPWWMTAHPADYSGTIPVEWPFCKPFVDDNVEDVRGFLVVEKVKDHPTLKDSGVKAGDICLSWATRDPEVPETLRDAWLEFLTKKSGDEDVCWFARENGSKIEVFPCDVSGLYECMAALGTFGLALKPMAFAEDRFEKIRCAAQEYRPNSVEGSDDDGDEWNAEAANRNLAGLTQALLARDAAAAKPFFEFPIDRPGLLDDVPEENFEAYFPTLFDEGFFAEYEPKAREKGTNLWEGVGWRGFLVADGSMWSHDAKKVTAINYLSKAEEARLAELESTEIATLSPKLRDGVEKPLFAFEAGDSASGKWRGRVDSMKDGTIRLALWRTGRDFGGPADVVCRVAKRLEGQLGTAIYSPQETADGMPIEEFVPHRLTFCSPFVSLETGLVWEDDGPSLVLVVSEDGKTQTRLGGTECRWSALRAEVAGVVSTAVIADGAAIAAGGNGTGDLPGPPGDVRIGVAQAQEEAKRTYRTLGKRTLNPTEEWTDVTDVDDPDAAGWRFFKVKVEMK